MCFDPIQVQNTSIDFFLIKINIFSNNKYFFVLIKILITKFRVQSDPKRRPFRFEAAWLKHSGFKDLLTASWKRDISTAAALVSLKDTLRRWNREVFGDVMKRKEKLLVEIKTVQDSLEVTPTDALLEREELLLKEFDSVLEQEELIWLQKSREKWFELGDRNTSFFHTSTVIRRRRNRIEMLKMMMVFGSQRLRSWSSLL